MTEPAGQATKERAEEAKKRAEEAKKRSERIARIINLFTAAAALGVVVIGLISLWGTWRAAPPAEPFTRVGGRTSVETALDAARFWVSPPETVVEVPANASQRLMLRAAKCAIRHDAPLLFAASDHATQLLIRVTIEKWSLTLQDEGRSRTNVLYFRFLKQKVTSCAAGNLPSLGKGHIPVRKFGLLHGVPSQKRLIRLLPKVPALPELHSFVVFAAPFAPRHQPDVAVGLALAAHLASARNARVSFVVVQRYLEADPVLERQLRDQSKAVTGGLVLGQTPTVPQDTLVLIRRVLTAPDQQGLLAQMKDNLGSWGLFLGALLTLFTAAGAGAHAAQAPVEKLLTGFGSRRQVDETGTHAEPTKSGRSRTESGTESATGTGTGTDDGPKPGRWNSLMMVNIRKMLSPTTPEAENWRSALDKQRSLRVTCWLRSGVTVTGTINNENGSIKDNSKLWKLDEPEFLSAPSGSGPAVPRGQTLTYLLVPVEDIVLVGVNKPRQTPRQRQLHASADG